MPLLGARWNTQVELELRALTAVVERFRPAEPVAALPAEPASKRPGWLTALVLEVLRDADRSLSSGEIKRVLQIQLGHPIHKDSMVYALRRSRPGRSGQIVCDPDGRYSLADRGWSAAGLDQSP